ncbi:MAG: hypothetical protein ACREI7_02160, partial [Myxococcota bacterium]
AKRRRGGGRLRRFVTRLLSLIVVVGGLGGGYWYFVMREGAPGAAWPGQAAALVARLKGLVPGRSTVPPAAPPPAAPVPVRDMTFARFDRLSDTLARAVRNYQERAALYASGRIDCATLARGLVAIENLWITYNGERRARLAAGSFDPRRTARDQALYGSVDSAESQFERSGCRRP